MFATVYSLWLVQKVFHGQFRVGSTGSPTELSARESTVFAALAIAIVWLGVYPATFLHAAKPSLDSLLENGAPTFVQLVNQFVP